MNRRKFIYDSTAATMASFIGVHDLLTGCTIPASHRVHNSGARILHLDLVTGKQVNELKIFYTKTLELPLVSEQTGKFTIRAGETTITFSQVEEKDATPFYHFAFNIPENKILGAREWQLKRTALSAAPSQLTDNGYPKDVRHFRGWNAHSVFFWDPAGNLVEYIARHDLNNNATGDFSSKDILCASEIAFIVQNTETIAEEMTSLFNVNQYRSGDENFMAMGDENGLLLLIKTGRVWESHTNISRTPATSKTSVSIKADKENKWMPADYPFEITAKN